MALGGGIVLHIERTAESQDDLRHELKAIFGKIFLYSTKAD